MDKENPGRDLGKIKLAAGENAKVAVETTKNGIAIKVTLFTKKP